MSTKSAILLAKSESARRDNGIFVIIGRNAAIFLEEKNK